MKTTQELASYIAAGQAVMGIEFGSTRIKAVLIDDDHNPIASGDHGWENHFENGIWTYPLSEVWEGLQDAYRNLAADVQTRYGVQLTSLAAIGFSAMMHGYLAFDDAGELLVPFRTWRNTITAEASEKLTKLFDYPVPQRWSISHLYQAVLNGEEHVPQVRFFTTLAGYVHWQLTGQKVLGVGDASGMFPIDPATGDYNARMVGQFDDAVAEKGFSWKLRDILPQVLSAGEPAGTLTEAGARLLDPSGTLSAGIPLCPPEGDAGTGMAATNSVAVRTGNVSAGTSVFSMVVLEKPLSRPHPEIDLVTTPDGHEVAMVHCNNCTSDINAWVKLFGEAAALFGAAPSTGELYTKLFEKALEADADAGGLLSFNYVSGEPVTGQNAGRPLFVRAENASFTLANFMRMNLYAALGALKYGMDILFREENVPLDRIYGHGGYFKTPGVGQRMLSAAIHAPVSVMKTAGEGGPWGQALLASYMIHKKDGQSLADFLAEDVFHGDTGTTLMASEEDCAGFDAFMERFRKALPVEDAAIAAI